ncbi:hypothetical protein [Natronococcus pandeyae]|uniref:hypothetical protein n=1 Tax=Natronococcus pandeyae TaxID=2055836 RepID=UPI0011E80F52|nr:hypothetical protein [Natronococcus pandeyae]
MAIVEELLAQFETPSGQTYRIEYNENGFVHLHTEHIRLDLTPEEFLKLSDAITEGHETLLDRKDELTAN